MNAASLAYRAKSQDFTLLELMVALAIVGQQLQVALPTFQRYADTIRFSEVIVAINTLRAAVEIATSGGLISNINGMYSGRNGIVNFEFGFPKREAHMHFTGIISGSIYARRPIDGSLPQEQTYIPSADNVSAPIRRLQGGNCMTEGYS